MRKVILVMLLAVVSSNAVAEWIPIGNNKTNDFVMYVNPSTILKSGNKVKMWELLNYKSAKPSKNGSFLSMKRQAEYDCKDMQSRVLALVVHSESMGDGNIVYSSLDAIPENWQPIPPETISENLWKFACNKL